MGLTITRKKAPEPSGPGTASTTRQDEVMTSVFGTAKVVIKKAPGELAVGQKVTVTNDKFPWVKHFKPGDTGVVVSSYKDRSFGGGQTIYRVQLDKPRVPRFTVVEFPLWAIEPTKEEG